MADISDVLRELVKAAAHAVYPDLTYEAPDEAWDSGRIWDGAGKSITGTDIVVYPGWPVSQVLDADLGRKKTHVTVYPKPEERNTTRYGEIEQIIAPPAPTITFSSAYLIRRAGQFDAGIWDATGVWDQDSKAVVTIGGTISVPQNLALRINNKLYVYQVQNTDSLASIAASFAALILADVPGTMASGADLTIGSGGRLQAARAGGFGSVAREVKRQERVIQITVWAATPALRDTICGAIDAALAQIRFLTMPDGFGARLIYKNSPLTDAFQKSFVYRRDLNYTVEYATTAAESLAAVIAPKADFNDFTITF